MIPRAGLNLVVALFCATLQLSQAAAQVDEAQVGAQPEVQGADDAVVSTLGQLLRCPVCQGMPIGESPAPMAQDMMKTVRRLRGEGQSQAQIEDFFISRYGAWVLLDPQTSGVALWVWVLPPMALGAGLVALALRARRGASAVDVVDGGAGLRAGYGLAAGVCEQRLAADALGPADLEAQRLATVRRMVQR